MRHVRTALLVLGVFIFIVVGIFVISLTLPIEAWRTGELPTAMLAVVPGQSFSVPPIRVWIDTDAACGHASRTDPDDCLAILLLAQQGSIEIVGVSTVFGNAPLTVTDQTTRALMAALEESGLRPVPIHSGSSEPMTKGAVAGAIPLHEAHEALRAALKNEPLTIVALGPLTNIAGALENQPDLQSNVIRLVAVMGRRKGHLFHPIEGGTAHSVLGHGPVFRDFNFAQDEEAATAVLTMKLPMTLVPYEAARDVTLGDAALDAMAARGGATAWMAQRARPWLAYWREDIGRTGFYPFDLIAAAYVIQPSLLYCTGVSVSIGDDTWVLGWLGFRGLFVVSAEEPALNPIATRSALYCPQVSEQLESWLLRRLTGAPA
ncbi:MAG: nucleoside hydrolase [Nitrospiraceae bacterium]